MRLRLRLLLGRSETARKIPAEFMYQLHRAGLVLISAVLRVEHDRKARRIKATIRGAALLEIL